MEIGMKRGSVYLEEHKREWETEAQKTIKLLRNILEESAQDIQHIGSTSIRRIPAKPIIDIVVGVRDYDAVLMKKPELKKCGIIFRIDERPEQLLFVIGDFEKDTRSHHIHVVINRSKEWNDYVNFRDYLNTHPAAADDYAALKSKLAEKYPFNRQAYTGGKAEWISKLLRDAKKWRETDNI